MDFKKVWTLLNTLLNRIVELENENGELREMIDHMKRDTKENTTEDTTEEIW